MLFMKSVPTLVLTGLAGSGRSTLLRILEDLGYFCIDNFIPALVPAFLALPLDYPRLALEMDPRSSGQFDQDLDQALRALKDQGREPLLVFVEASTPTILKRYALTRRPHPLARSTSNLQGAIEQDALDLAPTKLRAHVVLDTTDLALPELRRSVEALIAGPVPPVLNLMSFGYKYGVPAEANLVFDIRYLPNPFYDPALKALTGLDPEVLKYVFNSPDAVTTFEHIVQSIQFFLDHYRQERRGQVAIAIGCTGGQHRSVAFVEQLAQRLQLTDSPWYLRVHHREQQRREQRGQS